VASEQAKGQKVLRVRDLGREYRLGAHRVSALRETSFELAGGELAALVGPSGSGKTTLLNLLAGLETPTSGEMYVLEQPVHGLSEGQLTEYRRHRVGLVFQFFNLLPNLTAVENVALPLELARRPATEARARAVECLLLAGLPVERHRHTPRRLSGGEQQRVAIARALVAGPPLLLADEPTGNLDQTTGQAVMDLLRMLARDQGTTVIVATHNPDIARQADLVLQLKDGRLVGAAD